MNGMEEDTTEVAEEEEEGAEATDTQALILLLELLLLVATEETDIVLVLVRLEAADIVLVLPEETTGIGPNPDLQEEMIGTVPNLPEETDVIDALVPGLLEPKKNTNLLILELREALRVRTRDLRQPRERLHLWRRVLVRFLDPLLLVLLVHPVHPVHPSIHLVLVPVPKALVLVLVLPLKVLPINSPPPTITISIPKKLLTVTKKK